MEIVLIVIAIVIAGVLIWLASINGSFHVKKSIDINASQEMIYEQVADFKTWPIWSPWLCMEPNAEVTVTNDGIGVGAVNSWDGDLVGVGEIEHLSLESYASIGQEIRFVKPFKSKSEVYWYFEESDGACTVTWGMRGKMPFLFRFMAKQMEPWIGMDYERGLKMLRDLIEKGKIDSEITIDGVTKLDGFDFVAIKKTCPMYEVGTSMKEAFAKVNALCEKEGIEVQSAFSVYHKFDFTDPECSYSSGVPLTKTSSVDGEFYQSDYPTVKAVKVTFKGDYEHLGNGWAAAYSYARHKRLKINKKIDAIEIYLNDPTKEPDPANWLTAIYIPIK